MSKKSIAQNFKTEVKRMKFTIDHDYHIHSHISSCSSDPEQTKARILQYAKENGLSTVCLTDHYWDSAVPGASNWYSSQNFEHISKAKPLPQDNEVKFLFGCETDLDKFLTVGIPKERYSDFDFIIIPTTHLHMVGFTITKEDAQSNEKIAELWVKRLDAIMNISLPFGKIGIAHLVCSLLNTKSRKDYLETLDMIPSSEIKRIFTKAAELGLGIELNQTDMTFSDKEADTVLRPFRIAKSCGCKFYLGSDAHHPAEFTNTKKIFERAVSLLDLSEDDKFHILCN
jgi:histidinol phosphatase-like PHP family hydrolase